jgi:hypothetical protein
MQDQNLEPETLRASLDRARERRDRAAVEFEAASREIEWLEQGLRLLDPGPEEDGDAMLRAILPDGVPEQPTLRQAIVLAMRANPHTEWGATEIAQRLAMNGWTPRSGEPNKRVSDMANVMIADGQLQRTKTKGIYRLVEPLASAVQRALPPITDYRRRPWAPTRPVAASKGLADD